MMDICEEFIVSNKWYMSLVIMVIVLVDSVVWCALVKKSLVCWLKVMYSGEWTWMDNYWRGVRVWFWFSGSGRITEISFMQRRRREREGYRRSAGNIRTTWERVKRQEVLWRRKNWICGHCRPRFGPLDSCHWRSWRVRAADKPEVPKPKNMEWRVCESQRGKGGSASERCTGCLFEKRCV